jgi:ferredoxin
MEVDVKFEPSGRHGVVVVGTYLIDAALRFGIRIEDDCGRLGQCDSCAVKILHGADLLSQPTKAELEHLSPERRKNGERLSCQAKIEKLGEITVMTTEKPKPEQSIFEQYQKEFAKLPLEEKIKNLMSLESVALGDTFNYILNLPYTIGEKVRDSVAEFGLRMEEAEKQAKRPAEHKTESPSEAPADEPVVAAEENGTIDPQPAPAKKTSARRKPAKPADNPGAGAN